MNTATDTCKTEHPIDFSEFGITSYLHKFGTTEDGEDFIAEVLFIVAESRDGSRFSHFATFPCTEEMFDEEEGLPYFPDMREEARSKAEALLTRIHESGVTFETLNPEYWTEIAPAYGSKAYVDMDMESVYADLERREG
jgi:hypothetical protein